MMHVNNRSLIGNFDRFKSMIAQSHKSFAVIGISEIWLNDQTFEIVKIPGYDFVSDHRKHKSGGGTGLYLQENFEYKIRSDCIISDPDRMESLFVEIHVPNGKNIIVGTIYRPPNQILDIFLDKFSLTLSIISKDNNNCYLMGDFNLDFLQYDKHKSTQEFIDSLFSHMFYPISNRPTRLTSYSATLIDNIFTNCFAQNF